MEKDTSSTANAIDAASVVNAVNSHDLPSLNSDDSKNHFWVEEKSGTGSKFIYIDSVYMQMGVSSIVSVAYNADDYPVDTKVNKSSSLYVKLPKNETIKEKLHFFLEEKSPHYINISDLPSILDVSYSLLKDISDIADEYVEMGIFSQEFVYRCPECSSQVDYEHVMLGDHSYDEEMIQEEIEAGEYYCIDCDERYEIAECKKRERYIFNKDKFLLNFG
jgi:hypothetical protein